MHSEGFGLGGWPESLTWFSGVAESFRVGSFASTVRLYRGSELDRILQKWELGLGGPLGDIDPLNKVPFQESQQQD